jgi:hypothetical protein
VIDHVTIRVADRAASERFYSAYILDPDDNNVEVVNHNR